MEQEIQYVVSMGNLTDGFDFYGPFDSQEDAIEWASDNDNGEAWETYPVYEAVT